MTGGDPYASGPAAMVPAGKALWLRLRLKASETGMAQVFYFPEGAGPSEADSVRFPVVAGAWRDISVPLPAFSAAGYQFRIDPPGMAGSSAIVASLDVAPRIETPEPEWPRPEPPTIPANASSVRSGALTLRHANAFGAWEILIAGERFAIGNTRSLIGAQQDENEPTRWLKLWENAATVTSITGGALIVKTAVTDSEKAIWTLTQRFSPGPRPDSLRFEITAQISEARRVAYLPLLTLLPGVGTFGAAKSQAILAGVEYLDKDEPSSSEADIKGIESQRQVPDVYQLTLPLMAIAARGKWLALSWDASPDIAACFDSPDRRFHSGGHLLSLLFPGATEQTRRAPGSLLPFYNLPVKAGQTISLRGTLYAGAGADITPAIRAYIADKGTPPLAALSALWPEDKATALFAAGWLDSGVKVGAHYRHAYPGDFGPQLAADAAVCQDWLAATPNPEVGRLRAAARAARAGIAPAEMNEPAIGHVRTPVPTLLYANVTYVERQLRRLAESGMALNQRFEEGGGWVRYQPTPGKPDFGKTHYATHANGLTGETLARMCDIAYFTGSQPLIQQVLRRLEETDNLYRGTVPRGAQTWEVPLHTPDILASAHLVRAFVRGYEMSDNIRFLEAARYWAWTGVPFVYLVPPTPQPVGLYGTTPVLGATQWTAPNWIGLPVQWCGLVYADALYDLAYWDANGPWKKLADGIVVSGLQQTWPRGSDPKRQGLLPDSFNLPGQIRNDVAINPATLQVPYSRYIGRPIYGNLRVAPPGPYIHAPGIIRPQTFLGPGLRFRIDSWTKEEYSILVSALFTPPLTVRVNNRPVDAPYRVRDGWLIIPARGVANVEVNY